MSLGCRAKSVNEAYDSIDYNANRKRDSENGQDEKDKHRCTKVLPPIGSQGAALRVGSAAEVLPDLALRRLPLFYHERLKSSRSEMVRASPCS